MTRGGLVLLNHQPAYRANFSSNNPKRVQVFYIGIHVKARSVNGNLLLFPSDLGKS